MYFERLPAKKARAATVVLSSGLGGSAHFWQRQLEALRTDYHVIVYDQLGTGRSPAGLPKDYSIQHMSDELSQLLDSLDITQCHFVGHALGGLVGMQLAADRPAILQSMVLINAWSSPNPHTLRCFNIRKAILESCSAEIYLQTQALLLYPPDWIVNNINLLQKEEQLALRHFPDKTNLLARISALSQFDNEAQLRDIHVPTLVVANKDDMLVPWQRSQWLANKLPAATLTLFDYGGHASSITTPETFNSLLLEQLGRFSVA
ncbi:pyrimidine utilization protein D [Flavobacterium sp. W21_SRS_FM6]|uniref:pyrimidine utilization protein D n=1 Tax=Flavobacterium sp. W21_SRS_FM6 TaxID=3240268 RepID=UPI003F90F6B1